MNTNPTYKVFIIEDDGCMTESIEALLSKAGYVINYASTGLDGARVELLCPGEKPEAVDSALESAERDIRHCRKNKDRILTYKDIELNLDSREVTVRGEMLELTSIEYGILELMLKSPSKVFSKMNIFEAVWGETYFSEDNTINVHMSNLRSKLKRANSEQNYIQTVWGQGYRLAA
ncbi:MAG: winged helix-turn-helix domain-containing protein [Acutalibacteraceae bacterium]|nr:winged helix-turn-helix domain-containing protein [Bacillota bacterium]